MSFLFSRLTSSLLLVTVLAWVLLVSMASAQDPMGTTLELYLPPENSIGQEMVIEARLTDAEGVAVPGAEVVFQREVAFMNTSDTLTLGQAITDEEGWASLTVLPRSEGQMSINAEFAGSEQHGPASINAETWIQTGPQLYVEEAGVQVPGINVSLLVGIMGTVWIVYASVMLLIWLIAHEGSRPQDRLGRMLGE